MTRGLLIRCGAFQGCDVSRAGYSDLHRGPRSLGGGDRGTRSSSAPDGGRDAPRSARGTSPTTGPVEQGHLCRFLCATVEESAAARRRMRQTPRRPMKESSCRGRPPGSCRGILTVVAWAVGVVGQGVGQSPRKVTEGQMSSRHNAVAEVDVVALVAVVSLLAVAQSPSDARTPWGDPNLQGVWDYRTVTPLERLEDHGRQGVLDRGAGGKYRTGQPRPLMPVC